MLDEKDEQMFIQMNLFRVTVSTNMICQTCYSPCQLEQNFNLNTNLKYDD